MLTGHLLLKASYDEKPFAWPRCAVQIECSPVSYMSVFFVLTSAATLFTYIHIGVCMCVSRGERLQLSTCQPFSLLSCQPLPTCALYPMVQNREGLGKPFFSTFISLALPITLELKMPNRQSLFTCMTHCQHCHPSNWESNARIVSVTV